MKYEIWNHGNLIAQFRYESDRNDFIAYLEDRYPNDIFEAKDAQ